jgi:NADH-quinone oxidoreductase subunit L
MLDLLWLVPALPFAGFVTLILVRTSRPVTTWVGVGSVGLAALLTGATALDFLLRPPAGHVFSQTLWTWIDTAGFRPEITLHLDALSLTMILVITFVGFLIHLYSAEHMAEEEGYSRYFAYMNLFVGSMLTLVLAENLLLLYLGWEGVGLCSYLLIGFWYRDPANGRAARKAFVVTRVGDAALALALFLLFTHLGTLRIPDVLLQAPNRWASDSTLAVAAAALILAGAVGKSAQLPLQTWLPDAMAGPSPVSALIHAATMVTAGVYLIARTHVLFTLAPSVQGVVAAVGALTLLLAGFSALTQWDIKRVLAYSTISQIGYMFLALGVGAWSAAVFHFMTHAFFKALLFLGAGVVIHALDEEHSLFKMGGLRRELPVTFLTFVIGSASLAALPIVTAGFYSKDLILWQAWSSPAGSRWLWTAGLAGALLTSLYTFRMVFLAFFGPPGPRAKSKPGMRIKIPLIVLAALSIIGGWVQLPDFMGGVPLLSDFLETALPATKSAPVGAHTQTYLEITAAIASLLGIGVAYFLFLRRRRIPEGWARTPAGSLLHRFWFAGWGFDWLYDNLFVRPYAWAARVDRHDFIDLAYRGIARLNRGLSLGLSRTQSGQVRWYAVSIGVGAAIILGMVIFL